jgi:ubiquinone/menaquinone biosynthesis C-methylase UbiE
LGEIFERVVATTPLAWTGERLTSAIRGQIEVEHLHRYFLARELCRGLDVLDVAAGEGYGTMLLAQTARSVIGVELAGEAVEHASNAYRASNIKFMKGDARHLPLHDASVDVVVSFETIEHFYEHDQFLSEVCRVLRPGGRLIISSPDRDTYSPSGSNANPFHVRELSGNEFNVLLDRFFSFVYVASQRPLLGSAIVSSSRGSESALTFERRGDNHFEVSAGLPRAAYLVAVASNNSMSHFPDSVYIESAEIGALLEDAKMVPVLRARLSATQSAHESFRNDITTNQQRADALANQLRDQTKRLEVELVGAKEELAEAKNVSKFAQDEASAACFQRDLARAALRRAAAAAAGAAAAAEGHWAVQVTELQRRIEEAEISSLHWQGRYEALRARLESILKRFWIIQASRAIPAPVRHLIRQRIRGRDAL